MRGRTEESGNLPDVLYDAPKLDKRTNEATSPEELIHVLKRYIGESNEGEFAVAAKIGVNHHTLHRWLTAKQSPRKERLALAACFLMRAGYLQEDRK
jgi:hypothetical protein